MGFIAVKHHIIQMQNVMCGPLLCITMSTCRLMTWPGICLSHLMLYCVVLLFKPPSLGLQGSIVTLVLHDQSSVQIDCSSNKLQELPSGLGAASGLLSLKSSHNTLTSLQPVLPSAWSRLISLDISHNSFSALPEALSSLNRHALPE